MSAPLLEIRGLSRDFVQPSSVLASLARRVSPHPRWRARAVHAVNDLSLTLAPGQAMGLVGESGCGKSTVARMVAGLIAPTRGEILFRGRPMAALTRAEQLKIQMVFQDPYSSLNPRMRLGEQLAEAVRVHDIAPRADADSYLRQVFADCGIDPVLAERYPHQVSGGQRQRFGIARALAMQPDLILCDEPVAALDVSIQAQIINLFMDLQRRRGLSYLFISHDLTVVRHLCQSVAVMYLGRVVESGPVAQVLGRPAHPYTQALWQAAPRVTQDKQDYAPIRGEIPSPLAPPAGCHFHPRCPVAQDRCRIERPALHPVGPDQQAACLLVDAVPA